MAEWLKALVSKTSRGESSSRVQIPPFPHVVEYTGMFDQIIALIAGTLIGFALAIPVGPVGLIVFKRGMLNSHRMGLIMGLGAALTDGFLASIGAFGIKIIWDFVIENHITLRLIGGSIIFITGLVGVFSKQKPEVAKKDSALTAIEHFISGILLTGTNPIAAFSFFVVFASIGHRLGLAGGDGVATALVGGVVVGSCLWWIALSYLGRTVGHRVKSEHFDIINKCFGIIIALIGAAMLIGAFLK